MKPASKWKRRMVWLVLLVVLGIPMGMAAVVTAFVYQTMHPMRFTRPGTPADDGLAFEEVRFPAEDGVNLSGWWVPAPAERATVILCHGYPADRGDMRGMIPFLHKAGYNVLAFDFRRLGRSEGDRSTVGLVEPADLHGAVTYALSRSDRPVGVLGISMGAAVSLMQAGRDERIRAVVADSPYASLDRMCERRWAVFPAAVRVPAGAYTAWMGDRVAGRPLREASPLRAVVNLGNRPLLLIHGTDDHLIPASDSQEIANAASGPADLWLAPGSDHVHAFVDHRDEYEQRVLAFFNRSLTRK